MRKLLRYMRRNEWIMAAVCALLILGQIYFDLSLPDYMSSLTVLIKTPGTTMDEILRTGLEMLGCTLASARFISPPEEEAQPVSTRTAQKHVKIRRNAIPPISVVAEGPPACPWAA